MPSPRGAVGLGNTGLNDRITPVQVLGGILAPIQFWKPISA